MVSKLTTLTVVTDGGKGFTGLVGPDLHFSVPQVPIGMHSLLLFEDHEKALMRTCSFHYYEALWLAKWDNTQAYTIINKE